MLDNFRSNMRGMATFIVVIIGGIFAFSGTGSLFVSGTGGEAALLVNDEPVSALRVQQVLSTERQRILADNEDLDPALLDDELIRPQVIQQLIARKVLAQSAAAQGLGVSSKTVSEIIVATEGFQSNGQFDQDLFQYAIRNQGYTSATFVDMVKEDLLIQQFLQGLSNTNFVTQAEIESLAAFTEQTRDYYYLSVPVQPIKDAISITDQQVADYFAANQAQYQTEEQVTVEAIELNADLLIAEQTVTDQQIQARFDQEAASISTSVNRQAAHILLSEPSAEILQEIQDRLDSGEEFAALAKQYSEDFGSSDTGGDLGFTSGDTFPEAFETALATLEIGEVSAPVVTDAGTHLIKLLDTQQQSFDLANESGRIRQDLLREAATDLLVEKLEMLKELSFNSETLAEVAAELGLQAQISQPFSRNGGDGVAAYPLVVRAAFSPEVLEDEYASEVLELGDDRYVVIKLKEFFPSRQKELDEVIDIVSEALTLELAQQQLATQGEELLARVEAGDSVESVAKEAGLEWQVGQSVKRATRSVNEEVKARVFQLSVPREKPINQGFYAVNGDYILVSLTAVTPGDASKMSAEQKASLIYTVQSVNSSRDVEAYQQSLLADAEVVQ